MLRAPQEGERRVRCGVPLFDRRAAGATWEKLLLSVLLSASPAAAQWEIPAGTPFEVRLSTPIGSFHARPGTPVAALLIAPVSVGERTLLVPGTSVSGRVTRVRRVGLGLVRETAVLELEFNELAPPDGAPVRFAARVAEVDNARERVNAKGRIQGSRTTSHLSYRTSRYLTALLLCGVEAQAIKWITRSVVVHVPDPEIYLPAGAEMKLELTAPLSLEGIEPPAAQPALGVDERADLSRLVKGFPLRTYDRGARGLSDPINLLFVGSASQVEAAFAAGGWAGADPITLRTAVKAVCALAAGQGYRELPISPLLWRGAPPAMAWQKGFNTLAKRHHIRLWQAPECWNGRDLWVAAATRDVRIGFFRSGLRVTHRIEEDIDQERSKVLSDLRLTGMVTGIDFLERPEVAAASGDRIATDGRIAVVLLGEPPAPRPVPETAEPGPRPADGSRLYRLARRQILSARNDLIRDNIYWKTGEGLRRALQAIRSRKSRPPAAQQTVAALDPGPSSGHQ